MTHKLWIILKPEECWELDMNKRPSFADIENFLNAHYKKLAGGIYKDWLQLMLINQRLTRYFIVCVGGFEVE